MILNHKIEFENKGKLILWKITESTEELEEQYHNQINLDLKNTEYITFQSSTRKKEWLCTRLLLNSIYSNENFNIEYDLNRKPSLKNSDLKISISHSRNLVGILLSPSKYVGIDLEVIGTRIEKLADKFLNKIELNTFNVQNKEELHILWSSKEVLYKVYSNKNLDFKSNLLLSNLSKEDKQLFGQIITEDTDLNFKLQYFFLENNIIVWCNEQ